MGLPNINVIFKNRAATVSARAGQGTVAIILQDAATAAQGFHELMAASDIPAALGVENKAYIERAFMGYVNRPGKVLVYVLPADAADYTVALTDLATREFDYLVGAPDMSEILSQKLEAWIKAQRADFDRVYKAVLPNVEADHEAIINFTGSGITAGGNVYTAAQYCSRVAGIIAGTPLTMACTYAPMEEVTDVTRHSVSELDGMVDKGELVLFHDGQKVKLGRGVTSLTTLTGKSAQLQKIKLAAVIDLIKNDLKLLGQDTFIGRYSNSYDNKMVLVTAIKEYFRGLEGDGILQSGHTAVDIDVNAQREYIKAKGEDVANMSEAQIRQANTDSHVFITCAVRLLDAIEDIDITVEF